MPDQTFFDQQTRIDNLLAEFINVQKNMNRVLIDQSQVLTNLVSAGLQSGTITIVQKALPQSSMNDLLYDHRNGKFFEKISTITESKQYTIPAGQAYNTTYPYNTTDFAQTLTVEQENLALTEVQIQGLNSVNSAYAAAIIFRNSLPDSGLGYSWQYFRNLPGYNDFQYSGIAAQYGRSVKYTLPFPIIFQWKLNDVIHGHFRNLDPANAYDLVLTLSYLRLREVD